MLGSRKTMNELREEYTGITIKAFDQNVEARPTLTTRRTGLQWLKRNRAYYAHTTGGNGLSPFRRKKQAHDVTRLLRFSWWLCLHRARVNKCLIRHGLPTRFLCLVLADIIISGTHSNRYDLHRWVGMVGTWKCWDTAQK